jgi:hypothetical protein
MKTKLIYVFIVSLIVAGLIGVSAILRGGIGEIEIRILFSTLAFTVYSIIGLCCNTIVGTRYDLIAKIGLLVTAGGLGFAIITTWATPDNLTFLQTRFSFLVIAIGFAHASLLLLVDQKTAAIKIAVVTAIAASVVVAIILVNVIHGSGSVASFQLLGVASLVGMIATLCAPLLSKATP